MIIKYELDFQKTKNFFKNDLKDVNKLSNSVFSFLDFEKGKFFALLTKESDFSDVYNFKSGGKTFCLREEVSEFIYQLFKNKEEISYIFDDFNSDTKNIEDDFLFESYGVSFDCEVYYLINRNVSQELVLKCLQRSDVIWHSLCIVSEKKIKDNKQTITQDEMKEICLNAKLVMVGAYDAETYIIWEKNE